MINDMTDPTLCAVEVNELGTRCEAPAVTTVEGELLGQRVKVGVCATHKPYILGPITNTTYSVGYGTARCASCGEQVEGTVEYLMDVHVPGCLERRREQRTRG